MNYAGRMWGFLSCFICLTEALHNISDVNKYKGSNWLQSYVHILCADYKEQRLGIISIPCIGAGIYVAFLISIQEELMELLIEICWILLLNMDFVKNN